MNTTKKLQQAKLDQWAVLCKEQSESGLTVRQWCEQNGYTIHTYNYWKHRLKESYVDSVLPDIVPITPQPPAPLHELRDSRASQEVHYFVYCSQHLFLFEPRSIYHLNHNSVPNHV